MQIEIPSVEIVAVDDIYIRANELRYLGTARECPFVSTVPPVGETGRIGESIETAGEPPHAGQGAFAGTCAIRKPLERKG